MAQTATLSQLSATLNFFNHSLNESNKLSGKVLQTIQEYLNNPQVTSLDEEDNKSMQLTLERLEKLREPATLARVSSITMEKINQQLENLEELILDNSAEMLGDAYFVVVNLEVCFLDILSKETENFSKQRQKLNEKEITTSEMFTLSANTPYPDAFYLDRQQRLISELMNAALFDIIEYFQREKQSFTEYFTKEFLNSLNEKVKNPNHLLKEKVSNDVFSLLSKTSNDYKLLMPDLIHHLRYAIIGFGERMNDFAEPLQEYIRKTRSPTLAGFNKTFDSSWALTSKEVDLFNGLFGLYCKMVLSPSEQISEVPTPTTSSTKTADTIEAHIQSSVPIPSAATAASSIEEIAECELTQPLSDERYLQCVWIGSDMEKHYKAFQKIIKPVSDNQYTPEDFLLGISDDWIDNRIFLCLSTTSARNLLPKIYGKVKLYRVYVLCNEKSEENQFLQDDKSFSKIRLVTNDEGTFVEHLALDIVPSLIEIGDIYLKEKQYDNARRWFRSAESKITKYDKSKDNKWLPIIKEKLKLC